MGLLGIIFIVDSDSGNVIFYFGSNHTDVLSAGMPALIVLGAGCKIFGDWCCTFASHKLWLAAVSYA